tara:strand:+ start:1698 stop:3464 length:1767 start_codon:yes stop_codon:yes gene_type:complete
MAKVTRKRLARGTKFVTEHVFTPIDDGSSPSIGHQINNAGLDNENLAHRSVPFRVNLNIPFIDSRFGSLDSRTFSVPFVLPPLQDTFGFTTNGVIKTPTVSAANSPVPVILDELSLGFDQRAEPAAIEDNWSGSAVGFGSQDGKLNYDEWSKLSLKVSIFQKPAKFFNPMTGVWPNEIVSFDVPYSVWVADGPFVVKDLNKAIDPYKTYALGIEFPDSPNEGIAFVNICVSMKFRHDLVARDQGDTIQNIPTKSRAPLNRVAAGQAVTITVPSATSKIEADTADGVSHNLGIIDEALSERFRGGIDSHGETAPYQEMELDAGYEVIAVPLMGNRRRGGISPYDSDLEPYMKASTAAAALYDRRIIPLAHPVCVHHVFLAYNWQRWNNVTAGGAAAPTTYVPQSANFTVDVGVGIGTGLKGDNFTYDQVASASLANPAAIGGTSGNPTASSTWLANTIDWVKTAELSGIRNYSLISTINATHDALSFWDWDMISIPLVGSGGTGYTTQGKPVYAGRSWTPTAVTAAYANNREDIAGGAPNCKGSEQFLEVRMKISDSGGLYLGGGLATENYISGYGGHWVYLICKKMMT